VHLQNRVLTFFEISFGAYAEPTLPPVVLQAPTSKAESFDRFPRLPVVSPMPARSLKTVLPVASLLSFCRSCFHSRWFHPQDFQLSLHSPVLQAFKTVLMFFKTLASVSKLRLLKTSKTALKLQAFSSHRLPIISHVRSRRAFAVFNFLFAQNPSIFLSGAPMG
jgi:hypothetical protein